MRWYDIDPSILIFFLPILVVIVLSSLNYVFWTFFFILFFQDPMSSPRLLNTLIFPNLISIFSLTEIIFNFTSLFLQQFLSLSYVLFPSSILPDFYTKKRPTMSTYAINSSLKTFKFVETLSCNIHVSSFTLRMFYGSL